MNKDCSSFCHPDEPCAITADGKCDVEMSMAGLLFLLADIRAAVGDPHGKLMQDELVQRCRKLRKDNDRMKDLLADGIAQHKDPESPWYNDCEEDAERCQWCVDAQVLIDGVNDKSEEPRR